MFKFPQSDPIVKKQIPEIKKKLGQKVEENLGVHLAFKKKKIQSNFCLLNF